MYHLHLGVIRVCAIRLVACAGRRRRRWWQRWRLTHLAATVVDILARTDQQGRNTHVTPSCYRRRESDREIARSGRRRREESVAERAKSSRRSPRSCGVLLRESASPQRRGCVIVRLDGGDIRRWLSASLACYTASGERSQKRR